MDVGENKWLKVTKNGNFKRKNKANYLKIKNFKISASQAVVHEHSQSVLFPDSSNNLDDGSVMTNDTSKKGILSQTGNTQNDMDMTSTELRLELEADEDEEEFTESMLNREFRKGLREWGIKYNIRQNALKDLINIVNERIPNLLPKDPRTLLQTPSSIILQEVGQGLYWHQGLKLCLDNIVNRLADTGTISMKINIDGLPTYKSSKDEFWPILFNIREIPDLPPMVIGIYCGKAKPSNLEGFLNPFVEEMRDLIINGYYISDKKITVKLECFICDSPARAFIKGVANFNSQNGCQKCTIIGEYSYLSRTNYYPRKVCSKRTDADYRLKSYGSHHKFDSPLLQLPIDMIQDFPVADSLHLIDLGITKRCLIGWRDGNFGLYKTKWSARETENISKYLLKCKMPAEIHRAVRGLDCLSHWKGLEYRTFLHYISIVILKHSLPVDAYQHFLMFFCAVTICSSNHYKNYLNLAHNLLEQFVEFYGDIYGPDYITSNVHNLCHLVDDVKKFGILPKISAYPFETKLFQIKNLLRTGHKPLVQAAKRLQELNQIGSIQNTIYTSQPILNKEVYKIESCYFNILKKSKDARFYSMIKLNGFSLGTDYENKWFLTYHNEIISFKYAIGRNNSKFIIGCALEKIENYFEIPLESKFLNIYASNSTEGLPKILELHEIKCKLVVVFEPDKIYHVFIPLLHTLSF